MPAQRSAIGMPTRTGPCPGRPGHRHEPAHALRDLVEARARRVGSVLAEAGDARVHEPRVDLRERFVIDAEARLHVGPEILQQHVGASRPGSSAPRCPCGVLQVERDPALVAMRVLEVRSLPGRRPIVVSMCSGVSIWIRRRPSRQAGGAGRTGAHLGQVEHGKAGKGLGGPGKRHFGGSGGPLAGPAVVFAGRPSPDLTGLVYRKHLAPEDPALRPAPRCPSVMNSSFGDLSGIPALKRPSRPVI